MISSATDPKTLRISISALGSVRISMAHLIVRWFAVQITFVANPSGKIRRNADVTRFFSSKFISSHGKRPSSLRYPLITSSTIATKSLDTGLKSTGSQRLRSSGRTYRRLFIQLAGHPSCRNGQLMGVLRAKADRSN
jgi:hypothetical protein